ncbi:hypothetical protein MGH68_08600 [Erysipelothrix sp. D19-032]
MNCAHIVAEGSPSQIVGDWNNSGTLDEEDLIFFENYAGLKFGDADFEGYVDAKRYKLR